MFKRLLENYRIKLVVLSVAILFWFAVVTESDYQHEIDVPIVAINMPNGKTLADPLPKTARVRFEGTGRALMALSFFVDSRLIVDLSEVRSSGNVELRDAMVQIHRRGMPIIASQVLHPHSISVRYTNLLSKKVPIRPAVEIETQPGYTVVGEVEVRPDSVQVTGPQEHVVAIKSVWTEPRRFAEVRTNLREELALSAFPDSQQISVSVSEVRMYAEVQKLVELTLQEIPVQVKNVPPNLNVTAVPSRLSLTVEGGEQLLLSLRREEVSAFIDFSRIKASNGEGHPAYIKVPEGVRYRNVRPTLFKLLMERRGNVSSRH